MKILRIVLALGCLLLGFNGQAAIEDLEFSSEEQRERYQNLIEELRCPKCLNANLAGSDAPIATDLRAEIYEQITSGKSDDEIVDYMTARYGNFILYRPPLTPGTALLWFGPLVLLLAGFFIIRRMMSASTAPAGGDMLSPEEQARLDAMLESDDSSGRNTSGKGA